MARGSAPRWSVLDEVGSAIESLVSETNWKIELRAMGYPLVNQWHEHKVGTLEIDRYQVDAKRLWQMTPDDAIGSEIDLVICDPTTLEAERLAHTFQLSKAFISAMAASTESQDRS